MSEKDTPSKMIERLTERLKESRKKCQRLEADIREFKDDKDFNLVKKLESANQTLRQRLAAYELAEPRNPVERLGSDDSVIRQTNEILDKIRRAVFQDLVVPKSKESSKEEQEKRDLEARILATNNVRIVPLHDPEGPKSREDVR